MLIQHRSKTRGVVRIVVDGLTVTNTNTNQFIRLPDRIVSQVNQIDNEGYWITDIMYDGLNLLANDSYRVAGRATLFLVGSVRTRSFNVYLRPKLYDWPSNSSIDWSAVD